MTPVQREELVQLALRADVCGQTDLADRLYKLVDAVSPHHAILNSDLIRDADGEPWDGHVETGIEIAKHSLLEMPS